MPLVVADAHAAAHTFQTVLYTVWVSPGFGHDYDLTCSVFIGLHLTVYVTLEHSRAAVRKQESVVCFVGVLQQYAKCHFD